MQNVRLVIRGVEIEDADVGVMQVRDPGRPDVRRDAVLVGQPEQRSRVGGQRVVHDASLLGNLDALQPVREAAGDVLLDEALLVDPCRKPLHRDGALADVREHDRRDGLVVRRDVSLGDPVCGEEHFLRMGDHGDSLTTSRGALSCRTPSRRG